MSGVPSENLLGIEERQGFRQLMAELPRERLIIAVGSIQTMEGDRGHHCICQGAPGVRAAHLRFPECQFELAECKTKATVAKVFVNDCVQRYMDGPLDGTIAAIAKLLVTDTEWQVVDECLQLHGGYGYINDYPIARMWRDARVQRIYGGSSEIMKLLIARSV
jgi:acyl-CoA dehydrogenase